MAAGTRLTKSTRALSVGLAAAAIGVVLLLSGALHGAERTTWDWRVRLLAAPTEATDDIVLVFVDQESLELMSSQNGIDWPWPRSFYGFMLTFFEAAGAASVTFDIIYEDAGVFGVEDDLQMKSAAAGYGRTAYAIAMRRLGRDNPEQWPDYVSPPDLEVSGSPASMREANTYASATFPHPDVVPPNAVLGDAQQENDPDGVFRHYRLVSYHLDQAVPTLGLAPLLAADDSGLDMEFRNGKVYAGGKTIPVDRDGRVLLRYTTPERVDPVTGETVPAYHDWYPAFDVVISGFNLASGGEPTLDPALFEGKHVLIGPSAAGLLDLRPNPLNPRAPGVTAHATALDNLLANDFLRGFPTWSTILLVVLLTIAGAFAATYAEKTYTEALIIIGFLALVPLLAIGGYLLDFWVPIVVPLVALVVALAGANVANYATEGAEKRFIRGAFSQYLSPSVIADIEADPSKLELGGVERELTMFFSDIQAFTTLSEGLEPTQLAGFLQHYLTEFVEIIQSEGGTIDKFEGDAIIAFWNAPLELDDHPVRGVRAALLCQRRLAELRPLYLNKTGSIDPETGAPGVGKEIVTRIGLNTARVSVGNFGSRTRMDYTALGDGMNLAARLEGANKVFGSVLMISGATRDRLDDGFRSRELGRLQVVGRVEPVTVFQPMFASDYEADAALYRTYDEGLRLWYNNRLDEARERFASIADSDNPASRMVVQIDAWLEKPPEMRKGWSGVVSLTEK